MDSVANYVSTASTRHYSQFSISGTYQKEVDSLKIWIAKRLTWMDAHMPGNCWNTGINTAPSLENSLSVYPNPSNGKFQLSVINDQSSVSQVTVTNVLGEEIFQLRISDHHLPVLVDISGQPAGIYFLKCNSEAGILSMKVLKIN
jgi:hypothetical protein